MKLPRKRLSLLGTLKRAVSWFQLLAKGDEAQEYFVIYIYCCYFKLNSHAIDKSISKFISIHWLLCSSSMANDPA